MELTLSWDLIVIVFFAVVVAYSFIVGKDESVKIIVASYIAIVAVQAFGNLLTLLFGGAEPIMGLPGWGLDRDILSIVKLILFVATIIALSIQGGLTIEYERDIGGFWDPLLTALFGFSTAGLLLSALLTYIAGRPLLDTQLASAPLLSPLLAQSTLVQAMVDWQDLWFCLPAILLLIVGFLSSPRRS